MKFLIATILIVSTTYAKDINVMVIDTGVDGENKLIQKYFGPKKNQHDWIDIRGHGTHVAGIIAKSLCTSLKIHSCKYWDAGDNQSSRFKCLDRALDEHIDIINFSAGGEDFSPKEMEYLFKLDKAGVRMHVAAGNEGKYLGSPCYGYFPACLGFDNLYVVGSLNEEGRRSRTSNYGKPGMVWELGENVLSTYPNNRGARLSGTSMATAMFTRHVVEQLCYR